MNRLLASSLAAALATVTCSALAAGATGEAAIAHAHALMAQNAKTVGEAHTHLHHVINCLVGPKGQGFDAKAEDPCKGHGDGAIPDAASNAAMQGRLNAALADAKAGLKANSLAAVQGDAGKAASNLQGSDAPPASSSSW